MVPNRHFVIYRSVLNGLQRFPLLAGDNKHAHIARIPYIVDSRNGNVCRFIGLAHTVCVFPLFWKGRPSIFPYIVDPRNGNVSISIGLAHAVCVFRWFLKVQMSKIHYIVERRIGNVLISIGSGRGGFQRTYKNNSSGTGVKLKSLYYYGSPPFCF